MLPHGYTLTDDQAQIDAVAAHDFLTTSYWSPGISLETVQRAIAGAFCIAVRHQGQQIAFARLITDYATFAYLADVYVLEGHRGLGLSQVMLAYLQAHPKLQGLRRWLLFTRDAHGVYEKQGWKRSEHPERTMLLDFPEAYK